MKSGAERVVFKVTGEVAGAPTFVKLEADKGTSSVYLNLTAGTYVALDLATSAAAPPLTVFGVRPSRHPAAMPKPGATISTREFGFTGAPAIHDGQVVQWANAGFPVHMIQGIQAPNLAAARKIAAGLKAGNDNAAGALAIGQYGWDGRSRTASRSSR